jgi:electron transport complex protein RnfD
LRKRESTIRDGSALITGILLALILPPAFPLWAASLGAVVAIVMGKMVFGGLGYNKFNPALVGRAFLQAAFPVLMTTWSSPIQKLVSFEINATTQATPLAAMKFQKYLTDYSQLLWGNVGGSIGETSVIAILIGGMYLVIKKYADWRIVAGIFISTVLLSGILWKVNPDQYSNPLFHLLSGGFMLGTFFMATDMVGTPTTSRGCWHYGIGIGFLIILIRAHSGLPEGVMYAILLMNAVSPLIDRYTQPRRYGHHKNLSNG